MNKINSLRKPLSVFWEPTENCNLQCLHCYTSSSPNKKNELSFINAQKLIDAIYDEGIYSVGLGGGEPLMIPYIVDLVKYLKNKNMNISLSTNALLLNEKRLFDLIDAGLSIIQISVDGIKEDHERLRGLGTYDKVIENIKLVNESGINYRIGSVVNAINYKNLRKFITDMKNIGVNVINFFRYMPINGNDTLALSKEQLMVVSEMLVNMYKKNRYGNLKESFYITFEPLAFFAFLIDKSFAKISQCTAGKAKFSLACNGDIYLCNYIRKKIGNINKDKIDVIWERISYENSELNQIPENCIDCDSKMYCQGGCKGFSFMQNNDYRTKDSACFKYIIEQK